MEECLPPSLSSSLGGRRKGLGTPEGWRFGVWKGGEEEGFSGHGTLLGHTYQNEAYAVPEEEGALGMGQGVHRSNGGIQTRASCKVAMTAEDWGSRGVSRAEPDPGG